jgi:hypothetical protein
MSHEQSRFLDQDFWNQIFGKCVTTCVLIQSTFHFLTDPNKTRPSPWDEEWKLHEEFFEDLADLRSFTSR